MNNNIITKQDSDIINWLRFPLIIAVVFAHSLGESVKTSDINWNNFSGIDIYYIIRIIFTNNISQLAVPIFFIISGYLFFIKINKWSIKAYKEKLKTRFRTLFMPYIFWNIFALGIIIIQTIILHFLKKQPLSYITSFIYDHRGLHMLWDCSPVSIHYNYNFLGMNTSLTYPLDFPLWFLRDLIIMVILTPIIYYLIKKTKIFIIIILLLIYTTNLIPYIPGLTTTALLFFTIGAYLGINKKSITNEFKRYAKTSYIVAPLLLILAIIYKGNTIIILSLLSHLFIIFGIIATYNIGTILYNNNSKIIGKQLFKCVFFVYCIHTIIITNLSRHIINYVLPFNNDIMLSVRYMLAPFITVTICTLLYFSLNRYLPKTMKLITGGR